jgi:hypothetical protein
VFTPVAPKVGDAQLAAGAAQLSTRLPLIVRAGGRYIGMDNDFEIYDLELDATYEGWGAAQGDGPRLVAPDLGDFTNVNTLIVHGYTDTFSLRAGGAYNMEALDGLLSLRAGAYYDSAATAFAYTRVDHDTLTKIAGTIGLGYRRGAFKLDIGYAAVASLPRVVGSGQGNVRPINLSKGGQPLASDDSALPAVNEGAYKGFTNIVSVGLTVTFDELFGGARAFHYGNSYEQGYVGEGEAPPEKRDDKGDKDRSDRDRSDKKPDRDADKPPSDRTDKKPDRGADKPPSDRADKKPDRDADKPPSDRTDKKPEKKVEPPPPPPKKPEKPLEKKKEWWEEVE